jgi:hypothetical protein
MDPRLLRVALIAALMLPLLVLPLPSAAQPAAPLAVADTRPDQLVLQPGQSPGLAAGNDYLSPPTQAPHPFTHMLLRREAHVPAGGALTLAVRASSDGQSWSPWSDLIENDDLWMDSDGPDVAWSQTIDVGATARFWQVRGVFAAGADGALPELRRVEVNTINAQADMPALPAGLSAATGAAGSKPAVVSRVAWGSPDGEGSRVPASYYPVNHMVVHHTADSSTLLPGEPNWAARVRAEWSFHTYTRGWGDVGYNYLIDPNGVIYEGRAGGDDAVAFHDTANYGSMGVVLIGTYATVPPTAASQSALVDLLAWKAAQKHIDPLGSSYYYGCAISSYCAPYHPGAITPNIAGHRQITPGHTSCPGDQALAYLPSIRNRVKQALSGGASDNGDLVIDELESGFAYSPAPWHEADCGYGGHSYWTYATDSASENSATWRPNIPTSGSYRVYAHIPQGCGLAPPPYASAQARYMIAYAGGSGSKLVDQNTATEWVDLGVYPFNQGSAGAVELYDTTGEPLGASKVLFFDAIKWVPESADTNVQLVGVHFDHTTVAAGELLQATFTVKNIGTTTLHTQEPQAGTAPDGSFDDAQSGRPDNAYVYDEGECFLSDNDGSYPAYPKESDRLRVVLGPTDTSSIACAGDFGDYPWRWGLNGDLAPGATRTIIGYVRFRNPGTTNRTLTLQAGLLQEYVRYFAERVSPTTITITPERFTPDAANYDELLNPLARVYRLGSVPDNFLARTRNPLSIPRGSYVGSFEWSGGFIDWGSGGPLGLTDQFLIEQTRSFLAPTSGVYTFRTTSDDGSWLWIDGHPVVVNNGLHPTSDTSGTITLDAGIHTLAIKYFERTGLAAAGYDVQIPGEPDFRAVPDGLAGSARRVGSTFIDVPDLVVVADDQGGSGVDHIHWSWNGVSWQDTPGAVLDLGNLQNSTYHLRYQAVDAAGNQGDLRDLNFTVNTSLTVYRSYLPLLGG